MVTVVSAQSRYARDRGVASDTELKDLLRGFTLVSPSLGVVAQMKHQREGAGREQWERGGQGGR